MAIEKMLLARVTGPAEQLDNYLSKVSLSGVYHPEEAINYLSASMGYAPLKGENPYSKQLDAIREIAQLAEIKLVEPKFDTTDSDDYQADVTDYVSNLKNIISGHTAAVSSLLEQKQICENYIAKLNHFTDLDVSIDDLLNCEFLVVRFGSIPKYSYSALTAYESDPYLLFTPCSSDDTSYWGVYCAPREKIDEVDAVFASLYFEPLKVDNSNGSVTEIIAEISNNIRIVDDELSKLYESAAATANENTEKMNLLYSALTAKSNGFEMRKFAAVHNDDFYCVGWIPERHKQYFLKYISEVPDVQVQFSHPEAVGKHTPPT